MMTFSQEQNKLPLDAYNTNPVGAYGLRKLRTNYTGNCIRIRRASDNTETDIGFTATGVVNTSSIATFCSGTTGYITTFYDQSGAGNNATQITAAQQMVIYELGAVPTINGRPAAYSANGIMGYLINKTSSVQISTHIVITSIEAAPQWTIWQNGTNQYAIVADAPDSGIIYSQATAGTDFVNGSLADLSTRLRVRNAFPQNQCKLLSQCGWTPSSTWGAQINILNYPDATYKFQGYLQEFILYYNNTLQFRQAIEGNIREYYRLWS